MKLRNLLILGCLILGINSLAFAQTNLMANWAGPNGTGAAVPTEYGWGVRTGEGNTDDAALVAWNTANASSGVRYRDIDATTNPQTMMDGAVWSGRVLYLRWDAGTSTLNYVFHYPVTLQAGKTYRFNTLYQWWSNGGTATSVDFTIGVSRDMAGMDNVTTATFNAPDRNVMRPAEMTFTAPTSGTYYMTFKANQTVLSGFSNFRLVEVNTTSSAKDLLASNYTIYPNPSNRADGLFIAANEAAQLYIYNVTGQLQKQVDLKAAQDSKVDISDLAAGMYVAKVVTSKGSFNKSLVIQ